MLLQRCVWIAVVIIGIAVGGMHPVAGQPHRILLDTDVDTDDLFALLYLLKLNKSEFDLQVNGFIVQKLLLQYITVIFIFYFFI